MSAYTLITGASTGIGCELALLCGADKRNLIVVARSEDKLIALAEKLRSSHDVHVEILVQDLSAPGAVEIVHRETTSRGLEVETLINNAGYGYLGGFHEAELDNQLGMVELNITALTHLTRLYLPAMVERGRGQILNVASTAAFQPGPFMAVYYATKAYVLSFSEALTEELRGTGITVTALCPGLTETGFQARAQAADSKLIRMNMQDARSVAEVGYRAMVKGKAVAIPGLANRLLALSVRFSPRFVVRRIVKYLNLGDGRRH